MLGSGEIVEDFFGATESGSPARDAHRASFVPTRIVGFARGATRATFPCLLHVRPDASGGGGAMRSTGSQVIAEPRM